MTTKIKVIHYLNQFFAGIGGEDKADAKPMCMKGAQGPGRLLSKLEPELEVLATIVAGDNYMAQDLSHSVEEVVDLIEHSIRADASWRPDLLIAGPAFNAGRYGMACAAICQAVQRRLQIPAVTGLYPENPAVESYRREVIIVRTEASVLGMQPAMQAMVKVVKKLRDEKQIIPEIDHTIARGIRHNFFAASNGASRALEMLLKKLAGAAYTSEYDMPVFDRVPPAAPVPDITRATLAVVTSGGIVPRGNPDQIESASASKFGTYPLAASSPITAATHRSVHGGYDATYANQDPNRVLPIDALREMEAEGKIGRLYAHYFATVGNATSVRQAVQFGREIAALLVNAGVQAVVLTST